jgi:hypothetical protein
MTTGTVRAMTGELFHLALASDWAPPNASGSTP